MNCICKKLPYFNIRRSTDLYLIPTLLRIRQQSVFLFYSYACGITEPTQSSCFAYKALTFLSSEMGLTLFSLPVKPLEPVLQGGHAWSSLCVSVHVHAWIRKTARQEWFLTVSDWHVPETPSFRRHTLQGSSSLFKNSLNNATQDLRRLLRLTVALTTNLTELYCTWPCLNVNRECYSK